MHVNARRSLLQLINTQVLINNLNVQLVLFESQKTFCSLGNDWPTDTQKNQSSLHVHQEVSNNDYPLAMYVFTILYLFGYSTAWLPALQYIGVL